MKWVTREKAKVDRIACPWLLKKFVDPKAEFLFVPREKVLDVAKEQGAIPYDSPGAELFHYKEGPDEPSVAGLHRSSRACKGGRFRSRCGSSWIFSALHRPYV